MKLKSAIVVMFAMPVIAFGGTCYETTSVTNANIPSVLCLESIQETSTENVLFVTSADRSFPSALKIIETSRHNEDRLNFVATAVIANIWNTGCEDGFLATLKVKSEIAYGGINPAYLEVSVETETTNDTCHSRTQLDVIKYQMVK